MRCSGLVLLFLLASLPASAADVRIEAPWLREPPPGQTGAAIYFGLRNTGNVEQVLKAATVEGAARAEIHGHTMHGDMMHMGPAGPLPIAPGAALVLAPGGYHLMVSGLAARPVAGGRLPFCVEFEGGVRACAEALVKGVAGK
jgi:copper(I)-binding protein